MLEMNWSPGNRTVRQFGTIALPAFAALGGVCLWKLQLPLLAAALAGCGIAVFVSSRLYPPLARVVYVGLCAIAFPIGWLVSHLLLAGVYYLIMTPIGQWFRLRRRDALHRRLEPDRETYWQPLESPAGGASYLKQF